MSDVVVVGGGLIGMLTARELVLAGAKVTLIERGEFGQESSWAGGGILSPLYPWRYPDAVNTLCRWSQARFPSLAAELASETGIDPEWTQSGLLVLDEPPDAAAEGWSRTSGMAMEWVDDAALAELEPKLVRRGIRAQWWSEVAQIRNPRLVKALSRSLALKGATLKRGHTVNRFITCESRIQGVQAGQESFAADAVVVAAGAWSADLMAPIGRRWNIVPVRGQMLMFKAVPGVVNHILLANSHYLVPRRDGHVLVGSTVEHVGFDKSTTATAYETLYAAAVTRVPALAEYPVERHWAGLRPGSPDGVPLIGEHPACRGLFINAGHFRNGVVAGPASARLLADILLQRAPAIDPAPYQPWRHEAI